jgi:hypothetical protein
MKKSSLIGAAVGISILAAAYVVSRVAPVTPNFPTPAAKTVTPR